MTDSETRRPRRILLAVTGLSPQVVTETLCALVTAPDPFIPSEVHLITTSEGAERARLALLSDDPGWFQRLRRDYDLPEIAFDAAHIHVLAGPDRAPLNDIRSPEENAHAADFITEIVRGLSADEHSALYASIAGGRKTMGYYLGYALSLYGRPQDRLSHVLVGEPFESSWDFFYPTPYERIVTTRDNKLADCADAQVTLADIPFVRLRHGLPDALLAGRGRFRDAVAAAQQNLGPADLTLDLDNRRIQTGGEIVPLPPADLAYLAWFAHRALAGQPPIACPKDGIPEPGHAAGYLAEYHRILGPLGNDDATARRYRDGMGKADFEERKSKLKQALTKALGARADAYLIHGEGRRPMRYALRLPPTAIRFASLGKPAGSDYSGGENHNDDIRQEISE